MRRDTQRESIEYDTIIRVKNIFKKALAAKVSAIFSTSLMSHSRRQPIKGTSLVVQQRFSKWECVAYQTQGGNRGLSEMKGTVLTHLSRVDVVRRGTKTHRKQQRSILLLS